MNRNIYWSHLDKRFWCIFFAQTKYVVNNYVAPPCHVSYYWQEKHLTVTDAQRAYIRAMVILVMMMSSNGNIFHVTGLLCGNPSVTGEFPSQKTVRRSFEVFFDLRLSNRLSKQDAGDLRRHRAHDDVSVMVSDISRCCSLLKHSFCILHVLLHRVKWHHFGLPLTNLCCQKKVFICDVFCCDKWT